MTGWIREFAARRAARRALEAEGRSSRRAALRTRIKRLLWDAMASFVVVFALFVELGGLESQPHSAALTATEADDEQLRPLATTKARIGHHLDARTAPAPQTHEQCPAAAFPSAVRHRISIPETLKPMEEVQE